jgi:hypothetical protein
MYESDICIIEGCDRPRDKKQNRKICQMHRTRYSRHKSYDLPEKNKLPEGIYKICKIHGELKESEVYRTESYKWAQCLACKKISNEKFKEKNPKRDTNALRAHYYSNNGEFKLCKEKYKSMLEEQNHVCAICKNHECNKSVKRRLSIDHCHKTKKIRGLLCNKCNISLGLIKESIVTLEDAIDDINNNQIYLSGLGHFKNDIKTLQAAIDYLKKHQ